MYETDYLRLIYIDMDKQLVCDTTIAATNTEFDVSGKRDLNDEVDSYNNVINEKLRNGGAVFLLFKNQQSRITEPIF